MCMKNEKQGYYPTVILRLYCGYHLVMVRKWPENGIETGREWRGDGLRENGAGKDRGKTEERPRKEKMQKSNIFMRENLQMWEFFRNFVR